MDGEQVSAGDEGVADLGVVRTLLVSVRGLHLPHRHTYSQTRKSGLKERSKYRLLYAVYLVVFYGNGSALPNTLTWLALLWYRELQCAGESWLVVLHVIYLRCDWQRQVCLHVGHSVKYIGLELARDKT